MTNKEKTAYVCLICFILAMFGSVSNAILLGVLVYDMKTPDKGAKQ